jgi:hypothetical protein
MNKRIIFILVAIFFMAVMVFFTLNSCQSLINKKNSYRMYLSNTNFPVVFEDGNWSDELKDFVIKDLNCLYNTAQYNKNYMRSPVAVEVDSKVIISTNKAYLTGTFCPVSFDRYPLGDIVSIDELDYLLIPTNLMQLYENRLSTANIPDNFHEKIKSFVSGIKDMSVGELKDRVVVRELNKIPQPIEPQILTNGCNQTIDWFRENYGALSFSVLYTLDTVEYNNMLGDYTVYIPDDSLIVSARILMSHSVQGIDKSDIQLIYTDGKFKYFLVGGGE